MHCEQYLDLISARLDGELSQQEEAALTAHLQECPACRELSAQLQQLRTAFSPVGEADVPAALSQSVMNKIRTERLASRRRMIRRISGLAACLLLCVGVLRIMDAAYSEQTRHSADPTSFGMARLLEPQPVAVNSLDAYSLPTPADPVSPIAHLLNSEDSLNRFLAQLPQSDLSSVTATYNAEFFRTNRLLAMVVQEPSSSITHRVIELTEDHVTILRDVPETGDSDVALWLILAAVEGTGPETPLTVELRSN